ncbi:hypothetical protein [Streptomyces sp. NPDC048659]|uniref:hypothetical protein n=1 Tax=Streptomyces sp. NPDC048659 TaxID=3155489 RepID=UPI003426CC89
MAVPVPFDQVVPAGDIPDLEDAPLWRDARGRPLHRQWGGATYEVRNHLDGCILVCRTAEPTATNYPLSQEAELAFHRALADTVFADAAINKGWDAGNRAAAGAEPGGSRWAAAWISNGVPGFTEHDTWDGAHRAAAERLDEMADGLVLTGDTLTAQIASAHLRRCANQVRDVVLTAELGDAVRRGKGWMKEERLVTQIAAGLDINRRFLYRVFNGTEWRRL